MLHVNAESFIKTYSHLYFIPSADDEKINKEIHEKGIKNLRPVNKGAERFIVQEYLKKGRFDERPFAWKSGEYEWEDGELIIRQPNEKEYAQMYGKTVSIAEFKRYCEKLEQRSSEINESIISKNWSAAYGKCVTYAPNGFGPVSIFNSLFFISKGKLPIYDRFAHIAVRALALELTPTEIYMGANPNKSESMAILMFEEYIKLLEGVFENSASINNEMFISRELDRALWVYGHASKNYSLFKSE